ncbi:MAG: M56 family metallopeptidase [Anaerostipes sp.]|nr:M56 family metallopeptidase [Anaerostipes sp.]
MRYQITNIVYLTYEFLQNAFSVIFVTSLTGSLLLLYWLLIEKVGMKKGNPKAIYYVLKLIILSYLVPVAYVILKYKDGLFIFWGTPEKLQVTLKVVVCIWSVGFVVQLAFYHKKNQELKKILEKCHNCRHEIYLIAMICKKRVGIKRRVLFYQGAKIPVPMVFGIIRPKILIPDVSYTKSELEVALIHELEHCKHRDLLWLFLNNVAVCIHWFNPTIYIVRNQLNRWSEIYADFYAIELIHNIRGYYMEIIQMGAELMNRRTYLVSALYEKKSKLEDRMRSVSLIRKRKPSVRMTLIMVGCYFLFGTISVSAATMGYYIEYHHFKSSMEEEVQVDRIIYSKEKERSDFEVSRFNEISSQSLNEKKTQSPDWWIKTKSVVLTEVFKGKKGEKVYISTLIAEKNDRIIKRGDVKVGMIDQNGRQRYMTGTEDITGIFKLHADGKYRIFVENLTPWKIQVSGNIKLQ